MGRGEGLVAGLELIWHRLTRTLRGHARTNGGNTSKPSKTSKTIKTIKTMNTIKEPDGELLHGETTAAIIRIFYRVYDRLGYGFLESVYCNAIATN